MYTSFYCNAFFLVHGYFMVMKSVFINNTNRFSSINIAIFVVEKNHLFYTYLLVFKAIGIHSTNRVCTWYYADGGAYSFKHRAYTQSYDG